jgi:flagellar motor switch protein FliN
MTHVDSSTVIREFGDALAETLAALLETKTAIQLASAAPAPGYVITIEPQRAARGSLYAHFDRTAADALARRMSGSSEEPDQDAVLQSLREICGQAATTLCEGHPGSGALLSVTAAGVWTSAARWASATLLEVTREDGAAPLRLALAGTLEIGADLEETSGPTRPCESPNINVILDIDLPLVVRFGRTEMSLKDLTALGPGSLITLGRSPDDPVDVLVSNQIVARGDVVTVAGSYGVRIRDVVSPADRMRSLEVEL